MHFCPECGQACDCGGDIEDMDTGDHFDCQCDCDGFLDSDNYEDEDEEATA